MRDMLRKLGVFALVIVGGLAAYGLMDFTDPTIESLAPTIEYGTDLDLSDVANVTDNRNGVEAAFQRVVGDEGIISEDRTHLTFDTPGEYTVIVSAKDRRGNEIEAECPVIVTDTTNPQIFSVSDNLVVGYGETVTLVSNGGIDNSITVDYEDISGVSLAISSVQKVGSDSTEGSYEQKSTDSITLLQLGDYILTIEATDAFGNSATTQAGVSTVDLTPPTISGRDRITLTEHDSLPDFMTGVTAVDEIDGDLTQLLAVDYSSVQKGVPGTYRAYYTVTDSAGNEAKYDRIILIQDTTPPSITLSQRSVNFTVGDGKPDYKSLVSADDSADGDLTSKVSIDDSDVDYSTPGTYEVKYKVRDSSDNVTEKTIKVTVKAKASTGSSGGGTVYITRTGSKYHSSGCRYLSKSKIAISKSDAKARGYTACKVCRPG